MSIDSATSPISPDQQFANDGADASLLVGRLLVLAAIGLAAKLVWELRTQLGPSVADDSSYDRRSRRLIGTQLASLRPLRLFAGACGLGLMLAAGAAVFKGDLRSLSLVVMRR